jgi:protein-tyrosine-phosphatase
LIQQYVLGEGTGIELLANHGEIVYAFQHQRLHELPLTGGGSCYRKSIAINPVLLDASRKLISAINWHGVAMVEFKWHPDTNQYWLMEINGRFWGSLPLAHVSGADFPKMLFDLLVLRQLPIPLDYKKDIYCRKLTADLYWFEQIMRRSDTSGLVDYPNNTHVFKDFLFALHPTRHFFDIQCWSDPLPGIIDVFNFIKIQALRTYERLRYKALIRWHSSDFVHKRLLKRLQQSNRILFLCYGNINRSVLAQRIAEQTLRSGIQFFSAGFHETDKRPADPTMLNVAATFGVDLSNWQSNTLTDKIVENSDLILSMEIAHLERLTTEYPRAKGKCFLLGTLLVSSGIDNVEICDPYNQTQSVYINVFNQIKTAIRNLSTL